MKDTSIKMALIKLEAKLVLDTFVSTYKQATKGIKKIYVDLILSNDINKVEKEYQRFFGYIKKSKKAKEKWVNK